MKKTKKTTKNDNVSRAISTVVLKQVALAPAQQQAIAMATPPMFIRQKPGRGGKSVAYVETGYVISRLNATFSPAGWDFEVLEQGQTTRKNESRSEGEVWVCGKLTIVDHKNGYRVSKTQYGQHPIHEKVPIGDAFKAAASDCLKKCASMFGVAHDVYWKISEQEGENRPAAAEKPAKKTSVSEDDMKKITSIINASRSIDFLIQSDDKIQSSPIYSKDQKKKLHEIISSQVDSLDAGGKK